MATSAAEYNRILQQEMKRYNGDRDRAVRSANIATGYGNSTAQRFMHQAAAPAKASPGGGGRKGGGGGGGKKKGGSPYSLPETTNVVPQERPSPPRPADQMWQGQTTAQNSPVRDPSLMWQGATGGGDAGFPSDLAVSPPHERWPGDVATAPWDEAPPMNPLMSMASKLRSVPPELLGARGPGQPNAAQGFRMQPTGRVPPEQLGNPTVPSQHLFPGFHPADVFQTSPPDPNESWWRAMLRG